MNIDIDTFPKPPTLEEFTAWQKRFMDTPPTMIPMRDHEGKVTLCDDSKLLGPEQIHPLLRDAIFDSPTMRKYLVFPVPPEEIFD